MLSTLYASARPSVCPSHTDGSVKTVEVTIMQLHHTIAKSVLMLLDTFHPEILTGSHSLAGRQTRVVDVIA